MIKTLAFGIEIETVGLTCMQLAIAIHGAFDANEEARRAFAAQGAGFATGGYEARWQVTDHRGRTWRVVRDGSLSGGERSGEIVSPKLDYDDLDLLQRVVRSVRAAGAKVDATTGIHIHVDGSLFDAKSVTNLVKLVHKQERLLEHALGISAARLERYCQPIAPTFMERLEARRPRTMVAINEAWYGFQNAHPHRYDQSRYHGLNLNSLFYRGTIELRYFNGTLHAGEVKAYVQFALALAAKALTAKTASSKRRYFNPATAKYDFRVVLLHLGMIGDEFKTARLHLMKKLAGSAAWKGERRDRRSVSTPAPTEGGHAFAAA